MQVKLPDLHFFLSWSGRALLVLWLWLVSQTAGSAGEMGKIKTQNTQHFFSELPACRCSFPQEGKEASAVIPGTFPVPEPSSRPQFTPCQHWRNADWTRYRPREYQCVAMKYENCYYAAAAAAAASERSLSVAPPTPPPHPSLRTNVFFGQTK